MGGLPASLRIGHANVLVAVPKNSPEIPTSYRLISISKTQASWSARMKEKITAGTSQYRPAFPQINRTAPAITNGKVAI